MIRLARRPQLPIAGPLFGPITGGRAPAGLDAYSDDFRRLLRYGRGVDIAWLEREVGHRPRYSTVEAVEEWVARVSEPGRPGLHAPAARGARLGTRAARGARPRRGRAAARRARHACERVLRRLEGDYEEDEWGFDEEFADAGRAVVRLPLPALVAGARSRASTTCRRTGARCSSPTTRASCPGTRR